MPGNRITLVFMAAGLAALTLAVFAQAAAFDFVGLDDPDYVRDNPRVLAGPTPAGIAWAFTTVHHSNWHPLTWISLMIDARLGGGDAGTFHRTNVALHVLNVLLLFWMLVRTTRSIGPSAFVAALFAIHPLHVESVAWITERKDVLSALFWFSTMLAYVRFAERPSLARHALVAGSMAAGLLAKPMLVTLPIVLLLLDVWPLGRLDPEDPAAWTRRAREKLPLLALALASSAVTLFAQARGGAVGALETFPIGTRLANAALAAATYLVRTVWPTGLAVPYPYDLEALTLLRVGGSLLLLAGISVLAWRSRRRRPFLLVGWLWYLVTLIPVLGIVQVGTQARADRYTYVPLVGVCVGIAWLLAELAKDRRRRMAVVAAASTAVAVLSWLAFVQVARWRDTRTLFAHVLAVTERNAVAHDVLGLQDLAENRAEDAVHRFREALRISPRYVDAHVNLGAALSRTGRLAEAAAHYVEALAIRPGDADTEANLGIVLTRAERYEDAAARFEAALRTDPANATAHKGLGYLLALREQDAEATPHLRAALAASPDDVQTRMNLAGILLRAGRRDEAEAELREVLARDSTIAAARTNLGILLLERGRNAEAIAHFEDVLRRNPDDASARRYLDLARSR